jgi:hypothetical protein
MEMQVTCEGASELLVLLTCSTAGLYGRENAEVRVWYNLAPSTVPECESEESGTRLVKLSLHPSDAHPILRIEVTRKDASIQLVRQRLMVRLLVPAAYDACMELHKNHGQCLKEMDGIMDVALRTNHTLQADCLVSNDDSITGCAEWRACLNDSDGKDTLINVLEAFSMTPSSLFQAAFHPALLHGDHETSSCTCIDDPNHRSCVNPETMDLEAFDCQCWGDLQNMSATEINEEACGDANVCCDWKIIHCATSCNPVTSTLLEGRRSFSEKSGPQMIDESLLGKCVSD